MAAGGFKEFVAGETLDQDEINDFLMQGMLVFAGTAARGSAVTSPVEGQFSFLKDSDTVEFYDGTAWVEFVSGLPTVEYVVLAGGGGGGGNMGGGGGAGGYRCAVEGETSGGTATADLPVGYRAGVYGLTVGAGGAGNTGFDRGTIGSNSLFGPVESLGGGGGGGFSSGQEGGDGGSGGGAAYTNTSGGSGTFREGFDGNGDSNEGAGGGGGAGAVGLSGAGQNGGDGGAGLASSITGSSVTRAGGGGGGSLSAGSGGAGGSGGGGAGGADSVNGTAGTVNTGGGGGGGGNNGGDGGSGGSGVVIFSVPSSSSVSFSAGVTQTSSTVGTKDVYIVTATSTTSETVTFA